MKSMNLLVWIIIIVGGGVTTLIAWADYGADAGVPVLFCVGGIAWAWYSLWSWWHGLRRIAKRHLKKPIRSLTFIGKEIGASREVDYARVLESLAGGKRKGTQREWHCR